MNTRRMDHACFVDTQGKNIYVMGGKDENDVPLSSTEIFSLDDRKWIFGKDLPEPVNKASAVSGKSAFYAGYLAGGSGLRGQILSKIFALRKTDWTWLRLSKSLQLSRSGFSMVNVGLENLPGCFSG